MTQYAPMTANTIDDLEVTMISVSEAAGCLQCAICFEDIVINTVVKDLGCGHYFHTKCLTGWLLIQGNCPVCRKGLTELIAHEDDIYLSAQENNLPMSPSPIDLNLSDDFDNIFEVLPSEPSLLSSSQSSENTVQSPVRTNGSSLIPSGPSQSQAATSTITSSNQSPPRTNGSTLTSSSHSPPRTNGSSSSPFFSGHSQSNGSSSSSYHSRTNGINYAPSRPGPSQSNGSSSSASRPGPSQTNGSSSNSSSSRPGPSQTNGSSSSSSYQSYSQTNGSSSSSSRPSQPPTNGTSSVLSHVSHSHTTGSSSVSSHQDNDESIHDDSSESIQVISDPSSSPDRYQWGVPNGNAIPPRQRDYFCIDDGYLSNSVSPIPVNLDRSASISPIPESETSNLSLPSPVRGQFSGQEPCSSHQSHNCPSSSSNQDSAGPSKSTNTSSLASQPSTSNTIDNAVLNLSNTSSVSISPRKSDDFHCD
ncbi:unnamed protein product [Diamesa hyperborea]